MPTSAQIEKALHQVHNQESFFKALLATTLDWPTGDVRQIEDIAYGWSQQDLNATGLERNLVEGSSWQLQPSATGQPWGIFLLEFKHEDSLSPRRGLAGTLRKVLKGLVGARRKDPNLPSWKREHLLFICTYKWTHFRFAYHRSKPDEPRSARLTTFGWSPDTSNRTVVEFNLPALVWPQDTSDAAGWVAAWAKAFDKEPLTKDFFRRFDNALDAIKADLQKYQQLSSAEAYTQSQLLLERLIFLYFLQNRGWLNQDRRYLPSRLGDHTKNPDGFTYYHDFLDMLFWTLSTAPLRAGRLPGIPFLNGGLFDDDEFLQPANLRKTTPPLKVRNQSMQYVFQELLEAFNFTVTEDTPLNQEVAVDPEMLGKVFESIVLHAEAADPDAIAPDKRKATGSYYTPRIVVHFICQEVLHRYLLNHLPGDGWGPRLKVLFSIDPTEGIDEEGKQLLKKTISPDQAVQIRGFVLPLKCCDPAVGSGAFPVGLMHELVNLRRLLETVANGYKDPVVGQGSEWLHQTKAQIVENCLFGVDIQQQAIEICRLRLWLSLIVDYDLGLDPFTAEKSQFSRAIERISQLPNLEMNFRRGDSLHDHISGVPVVILPERASRHTTEFAAISKLGTELHTAKKAERRKNLRLDILEKRLNLSRNILDEELKEIRTRDSSLDSLFGIEESNAKKHERNQREIENLERALAKVDSDRRELEKLRRRDADSQFYPKLRKLEGADFDSPFNFAWRIDFPRVFTDDNDGFDIIVGNPPFVNVANQKRRELYRGRWPLVCFKEYQMAAPFIECSFTLLREEGQFGFIVSNGFAKREFGRPLVEKVLRSIDVQKVVDCSGLLFPGHGTPTCLLFAANQPPKKGAMIRNVVILPGGGDLRTPPEESPLWHSIGSYHDLPAAQHHHHRADNGPVPFFKLHEDFRVAVGDCDASRMLTHPCNWCFPEWSTFDAISAPHQPRLRNFLLKEIGRMLATSANDVYIVPQHAVRSLGIESSDLIGITEGDEIRNWSAREPQLLVKPYDEQWNLAELKLRPKIFHWLSQFKVVLGHRKDFGGGTYLETNRPWFEFHQLDIDKVKAKATIAFPDVVTHAHFLLFRDQRLFKDHSPVLLPSFDSDQPFLLLSLINSGSALFMFKQTCFNKGAGEDEQRDRFEYAGNKVQQLPVPEKVAEALKGKRNPLANELTVLSEACWTRGQRMPTLTSRKVLEKPGEAYHQWNSQLSGYVDPGTELGTPFDSSQGLRRAYKQAQTIREKLRAEMIALQEEMDWLVYAVYGLLPEGHLAVQSQPEPEPLHREQRPFALWTTAVGNYDQAIKLIPDGWSEARKKLWEARLSTIRDNEHIRRIEQPVYKRRWDEQWKVGNEWRCGEIA